MKTQEYILLAVVVFVGVFSALICWTLIVKNQVQSQLAATTASNPLLAALGQL